MRPALPGDQIQQDFCRWSNPRNVREGRFGELGSAWQPARDAWGYFVMLPACTTPSFRMLSRSSTMSLSSWRSNSIRNAAIEFCKKTQIWQIDLAGISTVVGQNDYALSTNANMPPTPKSLDHLRDT